MSRSVISQYPFDKHAVARTKKSPGLPASLRRDSRVTYFGGSSATMRHIADSISIPRSGKQPIQQR
jgi:hypothetical protein